MDKEPPARDTLGPPDHRAHYRAESTGVAGGGLPVDEPADSGVALQLASIRSRIAELEDTFRYMGTAHPHREATRVHIARLRRIIAEIEGVLGPT